MLDEAIIQSGNIIIIDKKKALELLRKNRNVLSELIERLWRFNENTRLGATAIVMYLYLLKLGEQNNSYVIKISDTVLSNILGIHRNTVKPFREKLKNFGLILYTTKNGFPCTYRILLNYSFESFKEESEKI
jgi:hypothetical protein